MTPEGNFDALLRILDGTEEGRRIAQKALEGARRAEITAALTLGILFGTIGTVIAATLLVWFA